jgi:hypothetical protein
LLIHSLFYINVLYFRGYNTPTNPSKYTKPMNNQSFTKTVYEWCPSRPFCAQMLFRLHLNFIIANCTYSRKTVTWYDHKHNSNYVIAKKTVPLERLLAGNYSSQDNTGQIQMKFQYCYRVRNPRSVYCKESPRGYLQNTSDRQTDRCKVLSLYRRIKKGRRLWPIPKSTQWKWPFLETPKFTFVTYRWVKTGQRPEVQRGLHTTVSPHWTGLEGSNVYRFKKFSL